jgi:hypothetical protein
MSTWNAEVAPVPDKTEGLPIRYLNASTTLKIKDSFKELTEFTDTRVETFTRMLV